MEDIFNRRDHCLMMLMLWAMFGRILSPVRSNRMGSHMWDTVTLVTAWEDRSSCPLNSWSVKKAMTARSQVSGPKWAESSAIGAEGATSREVNGKLGCNGFSLWCLMQ